ncbi:MAG TPA: hydroxyisourate hydrolase [Flavobacteriales bacterium]|nr:hydroxyisourate hydrolase [Flavobacteriales bacterium]
MSQITTHVLDTSKGLPAQGIQISLEGRNVEGNWTKLGNGTTDTDGRISNLLDTDALLDPGTYRMVFQTGDYYKACGSYGFYPSVIIEFETTDSNHYHIPLLLNPFGYSTYRGS